eukprot:1217718-Pleurochrysis_carterae.AAC.1
MSSTSGFSPFMAVYVGLQAEHNAAGRQMSVKHLKAAIADIRIWLAIEESGWQTENILLRGAFQA